VTTILGGAAYAQVAAVLWDDKNTETTFTSVVVRYPTHEGWHNGYAHNVTVKIDTMVAA
jgi:hypothetical protein